MSLFQLTSSFDPNYVSKMCEFFLNKLSFCVFHSFHWICQAFSIRSHYFKLGDYNFQIGGCKSSDHWFFYALVFTKLLLVSYFFGTSYRLFLFMSLFEWLIHLDSTFVCVYIYCVNSHLQIIPKCYEKVNYKLLFSSDWSHSNLNYHNCRHIHNYEI